MCISTIITFLLKCEFNELGDFVLQPVSLDQYLLQNEHSPKWLLSEYSLVPDVG